MDEQSEQALWDLLQEIVTELKEIRTMIKNQPRVLRQMKKIKTKTMDLVDTIYLHMLDECYNVPRPKIEMDGKCFIVDGERITPEKIEAIRKCLKDNPSSVPASHVAQECKVPLAAVYIVRVLA